VFYEVEQANLPFYIDAGLTLLKLGEEGRVPLGEFRLEGSARKSLRRTIKRVSEAGCLFEVLPADRVPDVIDELRSISDQWLAAKHAAEKGFSVGFFDPNYLARFPAAVVRRHGRIVAFANLWQSGGEEISVDLMRYAADAPEGVMEFLFLQAMLWGQARGFAWFNLGMAPLSGIEGQRLGPLWNRVAALAYRHGEHFYNFQGLRQYKQKFDPVWRPKFLASPGGLALPVVLGNLMTLVSGGLVRAVRG
jgi:phosphatidylglycerol lysyltransferase